MLSMDDIFVCCALKLNDEQRLVHSHACEPDAGGHVCFPESAFLRIMRPGPSPKVGLRSFRRLHQAGLLLQTVKGTGEAAQDEYRLSDIAEARFASDPSWSDALHFLATLPKAA